MQEILSQETKMNGMITKKGRYLLKTALLISLLYSSNSTATVTIAEHEKPIVVEKTPAKKKPLLTIIKKKTEQYQIEGYANTTYVRFVVETTKNNLITGQMFQGGNDEYVSGEIINNVIHLYGEDGTHYTVILAK